VTAALVIGHCVFTGCVGSMFHMWGPRAWFQFGDALPTVESTALVFTFCFVLRLLVFTLTGIL
jgi:hypothetical protein